MSTSKFPSWPAWRYGPNGESAIFQHEAEVPKDWVDSPAKVGKAPVKTETKSPAVSQKATQPKRKAK